MSDIVNSFDLAAIHKSGAIVSVDRLAWLNKQHVRAGLSSIEGGCGGSSAMHAKAQRLLMDAYGPNLNKADAAAAISLVRSRLNVMADVVSESRFLFEEPSLQLPMSSQHAEILRQFAAALQAAVENVSAPIDTQQSQYTVHICPAAAAATADAIAAVRAATNLKPPQLFPPIRQALTVRATFLLPLTIAHKIPVSFLLILLFPLKHPLLSHRVALMVCPLQTLCPVWECSALCVACWRRRPLNEHMLDVAGCQLFCKCASSVQLNVSLACSAEFS